MALFWYNRGQKCFCSQLLRKWTLLLIKIFLIRRNRMSSPQRYWEVRFKTWFDIWKKSSVIGSNLRFYRVNHLRFRQKKHVIISPGLCWMRKFNNSHACDKWMTESVKKKQFFVTFVFQSRCSEGNLSFPALIAKKFATFWILLYTPPKFMAVRIFVCSSRDKWDSRVVYECSNKKVHTANVSSLFGI